MPSWTLRRLWALTLLFFVLLVLWDATGFDLPLARWSGSPQGFALRQQPLFVLLSHELPRMAGAALLLALLVGVFKPWGFLCRLAPGERWQLWLSIAGGALAITVLKRLNHTSCPWDLAEFGGVARHVSHWLWGVRDGGAGHCFPAGHASTAFAYLAGWFVLRRSAPRAAGRWLLGALLAGMLLGLAQQMRGAHYMSHTLWTAWICWAWGLALETALQVHRHGRAVVANLNQA
ncbi:MAG TPA: phosphatase PAP2 family protein [Alicycliphilus sp.]|jgi:membrane-associated PAP2 superfamily phosphatase|uniref:Phosphatase PAP2 family protein n=1 Tax=Diaphorobacter limosus TaxID=3036128 RepID=A0ABZ0J6P6_9BURK|nr:phosphatase PAP2 family protein [Diaphorobacter sp. Y-1]MBP7326511.1 phosphatase PAP2 family protein [Alicycliphilus sp.]MCA0439662.1 phosphatase PAP2 family protein [Pseudomonadota bacterium]MBP8779418.1 phosphatase PAP2 family protein [Alicycliphilus sp.]TXJ03929.1 MAG: phosphatase PAP2 family protein [Alicycliphilus sp.]WOO33563.1 phosphatase PAP2 family protein [Diaphorobacter sp. Y-1]